MPEAGKANRIDAEAAEWFARMDRGGVSPDVAAAFERWLSADVRRQGAYARLCAIRAAMSEDAQTQEQLPAPARPSRRGLLWGGGMAAGLAAVGVAGVSWFGSTGTAYATGLGEVRIVPLEDGSSIVLNTQSRVRVWISDQRRRAELEAGEAIFNVAVREDAPFELSAGDTRLAASGGSIVIRRRERDDQVSVLVSEGRAVLEEGRAERTLTQGEFVRADGQALHVESLSNEALSQKLAWRQGMIALEGQTLREAADEFARYNSTPIVIDDPALARRTVTGLFAANDPAGFARSVALSFGVSARIGTDEIRLG